LPPRTGIGDRQNGDTDSHGGQGEQDGQGGKCR
jgi:hypothetical protein